MLVEKLTLAAAAWHRVIFGALTVVTIILLAVLNRAAKADRPPDRRYYI